MLRVEWSQGCDEIIVIVVSMFEIMIWNEWFFVCKDNIDLLRVKRMKLRIKFCFLYLRF